MTAYRRYKGLTAQILARGGKSSYLSERYVEIILTRLNKKSHFDNIKDSVVDKDFRTLLFAAKYFVKAVRLFEKSPSLEEVVHFTEEMLSSSLIELGLFRRKFLYDDIRRKDGYSVFIRTKGFYDELFTLYSEEEGFHLDSACVLLVFLLSVVLSLSEDGLKDLGDVILNEYNLYALSNNDVVLNTVSLSTDPPISPEYEVFDEGVLSNGIPYQTFKKVSSKVINFPASRSKG